MPLTWDSTETVLDLDNEDDSTLQHVAVFATMAVGINRVTEDNCLDFYKRVNFYERLNGAYRFGTDTDTGETSPVMFSAEDVVRLIGLKTNASPMTLAQFRKNQWDAHDRWNFAYGFKMPLDKASPVV